MADDRHPLRLVVSHLRGLRREGILKHELDSSDVVDAALQRRSWLSELNDARKE
jgi:hypothetical protein